MGHEGSYLDESYFRAEEPIKVPKDEQLRKLDENGNGKHYIAESDGEMLRLLDQGWTLEREMNGGSRFPDEEGGDLKRAELAIIIQAFILSFLVGLGVPFLGGLVLTLAYGSVGWKGKALLQLVAALWLGFESAAMIDS